MNTKRILSVIAVALITFTAATAQRISVVTEDGSTSVHRTLQQAIEGADPGSTIYLPGGGFSIADSVKITKRLTIIGIGHKSDNENADGSTIISGNLWFNAGSSGSALMSCYITGNVNIGEGGATVNDVTIKFCNLNSVQVKNSACQETVVNQCYIRGESNFGQSPNVTIENNIINRIVEVGSGFIRNNVLTFSNYHSTAGYGSNINTLSNVNNSVISGNIIRLAKGYIHSGNGCAADNNLVIGGSWGNNPVLIEATEEECFEKLNGWAVNPVSKFHFKGDYVQYEHQVGIYAGDSFNEDQLAPVPYIISKDIPQQTDAAGKLNIKIRVKAGD